MFIYMEHLSMVTKSLWELRCWKISWIAGLFKRLWRPGEQASAIHGWIEKETRSGSQGDVLASSAAGPLQNASVFLFWGGGTMFSWHVFSTTAETSSKSSESRPFASKRKWIVFKPLKFSGANPLWVAGRLVGNTLKLSCEPTCRQCIFPNWFGSVRLLAASFFATNTASWSFGGKKSLTWEDVWPHFGFPCLVEAVNLQPFTTRQNQILREIFCNYHHGL